MHHHDSGAHGDLEDHDRGLSHDLPKLVQQGLGRRRLLALFGGVGAAAVAGCASGGSSAGSSSGTSSGPAPGKPPAGSDSNVSVAAGEIPEETAGPYPGDGSNGANVLTESG